MQWEITYYNHRVEADILALPKTLLARYLKLTDLMLEFGPNIGMPHTRSIGDGLFELRMKGKEGIGRVFFCTRIRQEIVMLHTFVKKTQKTPAKELATAKARLKEVNDHD